MGMTVVERFHSRSLVKPMRFTTTASGGDSTMAEATETGVATEASRTGSTRMDSMLAAAMNAIHSSVTVGEATTSRTPAGRVAATTASRMSTYAPYAMRRFLSPVLAVIWISVPGADQNLHSTLPGDATRNGRRQRDGLRDRLWDCALLELTRRTWSACEPPLTERGERRPAMGNNRLPSGLGHLRTSLATRATDTGNRATKRTWSSEPPCDTRSMRSNRHSAPTRRTWSSGRPFS